MIPFNLRVRWPDGTYHGREWPPSPLRLFQALIAGYRTARGPDVAMDAALRHLETLGAPVIRAPVPTRESPVASSVPNNDGDRLMALWAKGDTQKARKQATKLRTIRRRHPWRFDGAVTYTWEATEETRGYAPTLVNLARTLSALGQGIDLAWAEAWFGPPDADGVTHRPSADGSIELQVPYPTAFDVLEARHQALRARVDGALVRGVPEPSHLAVRYRSELEPPGRRWALFSLAVPDAERVWSADGRALLDVAAMSRHAVHDAAQRAGISAAGITELMGHGGDRRIQIQPLPNVGHEHADGRIRRVLFTAPYTLAESTWLAVVYRLTGAGLVPPGHTDPVAVLARPPEDDKLVWRFTGQSETWTSATPAILPGWDHRRGKPRPGRSARRLLLHAGIPEALVESVTLESAPRLRGSLTGSEACLPRHLADLPRTHLRVRWRHPVAGPIALGAGAGYGFGLLAVE